jgi:hypothetical protein
MPTRTALLAVTGNAVVMGAVGVSAPIGWLLVPGVAGISSRPRTAALLAGWAAALIGVSVVVPIVPGHRGDGWSLVTSGICLTLMPVLSWGLRHARTHGATTEGPTVSDVGAGFVDRAVVMATSRLPGEIVTSVPVPGCGIRVLVGTVMGDVPDGRHCAREVQREFHTAAARHDSRLSQVAAALEPVVRRHAGLGYVSATLVEVTQAGVAQAIRLGGPEILAVPHTSAGLERSMCMVVDAGPAHLPLGLGPEPELAKSMPDNARIAIVTTGYAYAHYDDYTDAVHRALRATSVELAAVRLLLAPATTQTGLSLAGPALVLEAVTPAGRSTSTAAG